MPCLAGTFDGYAATWVGIGGYGNSNLVQTGTTEHCQKDVFGRWVDEDEAWVENLGDSSNWTANNLFGVGCNDNIVVDVWAGNCMLVEDTTRGDYSGNQCYGPLANNDTAEGIVERPKINGVTKPLADFQSWTLYGVSVCTPSSPCQSIGNYPHDYSTIWSNTNPTGPGHSLIQVGSLSSQGNYTMQWLHSS